MESEVWCLLDVAGVRLEVPVVGFGMLLALLWIRTLLASMML